MSRQIIDPSLGQRLQRVRNHRHISQAQLAKALGVSIGTIQNYEHGRVHMTADRLEQLARALQCQPTDLLMSLHSPLPKYRFSRLRKDTLDDPLDHLAAIWEEMRQELFAEKGIDIGDQPARDWIEAIRERMGVVSVVSQQAAQDRQTRIKKRLEIYHAMKLK